MLLVYLLVANVLAMKLKDFLKKATKRERADVAVVCSDSVGYLYQIAGGHRFSSPLLAIKIEVKTEQVAALSNGRLQKVSWGTLVRHPHLFCCFCGNRLNSLQRSENPSDES